MTIATTAVWEPTVDQVLTQALRGLGVLHAAHSPAPEVLAFGREAITAWMHALVARGVPMNLVESYPQTLTASTRSYSAAADTESVEKGGIVTDTAGLDHPLELITREDYLRISDKLTEGQPARYYAEKTSTSGFTIYLYPVPTTDWVTFTYPRVRRPRDNDTGARTIDLPRSLMKAAVAQAKYEYAGHFRRTPDVIDMLRQHADDDLDEALGAENPRGDLQFTVPSLHWRR